MTNATTILLVGGAGRVGRQIAEVLLAKPDAQLRVMARREAMSTKKPILEALHSAGATIVAGDLADPRSLVEATEGVDVVISAVQGLHDVIVDGQLALLEAARRNGVRRFMPSDFAIDLFKLEPGQHPLLDWRREADEAIARSGLEHIHVLNGAFDEVLGDPIFELFDYDAGTVSYWGDGDVRIDLTTIADTARFTAEAALDRSLPNGKFAVAGDQISIKEAISAAERVYQKTFVSTQLGTVSDLEAEISRRQSEIDDFWAPIFLQFQWGMVSGKAKLDQLDNERYPQIIPLTFEQFLAVRSGRSPAGAR